MIAMGWRRCVLQELILFSVDIGFLLAEFSTYPSIYWHPWNPIFACDIPSINVRIGDTINFICPSEEFKFYMPPSTDANKMIYENLYFLDDNPDANKQRFESCNSTGMRELLRCDNKGSKYSTITFRDVPTSMRALKFQRNQTYYFIGTGFRTLDQLDNRINGSCRHTEGSDQFRLRLRVNVCADEEHCDICTSEACYYENCGSSCSEWNLQDSVLSNGKCSGLFTRSCQYPYMKEKERTEYKREEQNMTKCRSAVLTLKAKSLVSGGNPISICDELEAYKIISFVSIPMVMILLIALILMRVRVTKRIKNCIKEDMVTYHANGEIGVSDDIIKAEDGTGTPNLAYKHSLLSKHDKKRVKVKKKERHSSTLSDTKVAV